VWLKNWSEVNGRAGGNPQIGKYLGIYFAFGIGSSALVVVQTLILWIFCSIEVSFLWHRRLLICLIELGYPAKKGMVHPHMQG
jgi:ATP-binding cassette subfamily C (CFTR/MRP) protein 1